MLIVLAGIMLFGVVNTLNKEKEEIITKSKNDKNGFSVETSISEIIEKAENLLKIADKYKADNAEVQEFYTEIESQIQDTKVLEDQEFQTNADKLKSLLLKIDEFEPVFGEVLEGTDDKKYLNTIIVEIRSLKAEIVHASYNYSAIKWNSDLLSFPANVLSKIKIGEKSIFNLPRFQNYQDI